MSLDKAIAHGKEHRKEYHGSKAIDKTCRNHGGCPSCEMNRQISNIKRMLSADDKMAETQQKE